MTLRLLVVESHPVTRWGLARMAAEQPDLDVVGEAATAAEAIQLIAAYQPDVVTVDVDLPDRDGLDLTRELRDRYERLGIVVLTAQGDDDVLFRALETGVSAFVSKQAGVAELLAAIRHAGVAALTFSATGLAAALRRRQQQAESRTLSVREREVLGHLLAGDSIPALAGQLYISLSTAKTYVARLYDKLGVSNRSQAVLVAARLGLADELGGAAEPTRATGRGAGTRISATRVPAGAAPTRVAVTQRILAQRVPARRIPALPVPMVRPA